MQFPVAVRRSSFLFEAKPIARLTPGAPSGFSPVGGGVVTFVATITEWRPLPVVTGCSAHENAGSCTEFSDARVTRTKASLRSRSTCRAKGRLCRTALHHKLFV